MPSPIRSSSPEPLLLRVARLCVGLVEIPGPASNPVIMRWAKDINAPAYTDDSVAWCAVFLNRLCLACNYPLSGTDYALLRALSFATWGEPYTLPTLGAVLVFSRPEGAHVGLYAGERDDAYYVLGGNQSNAVGYAWIAKHRLVTCRWPSGVARPIDPHQLRVAANGEPLSGNEA